MPTPLLNRYAANLPRLTAEESLHFAERVAVGTGSLRRGDARRVTSSWQRTADQRRTFVRPASPEMYAAQMADLGIGVKKVKKADG